jgi:tyrosyl-tRNA synthetase
MSDKMELKAYKKLEDLYSSMFWVVMDKIRRCVEYRKDKPDDIYQELLNISNPDKWDYCGVISKEDKAVLEMLEYLLDNTEKNIVKYKAWHPPQK